MELINKIYDNRIKAQNVLFEISIGDYYLMSQKIIDKNEFQRRRVKSSSTVYNLLKKDLEIGCIIPPIVLALSKQNTTPFKELSSKEILEEVNGGLESLIILDGLQRTYTIRDLIQEKEQSGDQEALELIKKRTIRIEIYLGINKLGILYRMLTLNTGQTPMSMRHQIEILYSDYLNQDINGVKLLLESQGGTPSKIGEYRFKEIIEGFNSYLDHDYLPINRNDILENIESLEKLAAENQENDLFTDYLQSYHSFVKLIINKTSTWTYDEEDLQKPLSGPPFGSTSAKIFTKAQVMTGFGSALGKLAEFGAIQSMTDIVPLLHDIRIVEVDTTMNSLISKLDFVRTNAKKIGNDQRMFFHFFFRELFDKKGDAYLDLHQAAEEAFTSYLRKTQ